MIVGCPHWVMIVLCHKLGKSIIYPAAVDTVQSIEVNLAQRVQEVTLFKIIKQVSKLSHNCSS